MQGANFEVGDGDVAATLHMHSIGAVPIVPLAVVAQNQYRARAVKRHTFPVVQQKFFIDKVFPRFEDDPGAFRRSPQHLVDQPGTGAPPLRAADYEFRHTILLTSAQNTSVVSIFLHCPARKPHCFATKKPVSIAQKCTVIRLKIKFEQSIRTDEPGNRPRCHTGAEWFQIPAVRQRVSPAADRH